MSKGNGNGKGKFPKKEEGTYSQKEGTYSQENVPIKTEPGAAAASSSAPAVEIQQAPPPPSAAAASSAASSAASAAASSAQSSETGKGPYHLRKRKKVDYVGRGEEEKIGDQKDKRPRGKDKSNANDLHQRNVNDPRRDSKTGLFQGAPPHLKDGTPNFGPGTPLPPGFFRSPVIRGSAGTPYSSNVVGNSGAINPRGSGGRRGAIRGGRRPNMSHPNARLSLANNPRYLGGSAIRSSGAGAANPVAQSSAPVAGAAAAQAQTPVGVVAQPAHVNYPQSTQLYPAAAAEVAAAKAEATAAKAEAAAANFKANAKESEAVSIRIQLINTAAKLGERDVKLMEKDAQIKLALERLMTKDAQLKVTLEHLKEREGQVRELEGRLAKHEKHEREEKRARVRDIYHKDRSDSQPDPYDLNPNLTLPDSDDLMRQLEESMGAAAQSGLSNGAAAAQSVPHDLNPNLTLPNSDDLMRQLEESMGAAAQSDPSNGAAAAATSSEGGDKTPKGSGEESDRPGGKRKRQESLDSTNPTKPSAKALGKRPAQRDLS